jgi:hypothetical protein
LRKINKADLPEFTTNNDPETSVSGMQIALRQAASRALLIIVALGCSETLVHAQVSENNPAATMKLACSVDYRAHCIGKDPAAPIAAACLAQFYVNLSKNCQSALDAYNGASNDTSDP